MQEVLIECRNQVPGGKRNRLALALLLRKVQTFGDDFLLFCHASVEDAYSLRICLFNAVLNI
jgi:hypothetical protein